MGELEAEMGGVLDAAAPALAVPAPTVLLPGAEEPKDHGHAHPGLCRFVSISPSAWPAAVGLRRRAHPRAPGALGLGPAALGPAGRHPRALRRPRHRPPPRARP